MYLAPDVEGVRDVFRINALSESDNGTIFSSNEIFDLLFDFCNIYSPYLTSLNCVDAPNTISDVYPSRKCQITCRYFEEIWILFQKNWHFFSFSASDQGY